MKDIKLPIPTLREYRRRLGVRSNTTAYGQLRALRAEGLLEIRPDWPTEHASREAVERGTRAPTSPRAYRVTDRGRELIAASAEEQHETSDDARRGPRAERTTDVPTTDDPRDRVDVQMLDVFRLAFATYRDRFPELTDGEFEAEVVRPTWERVMPPALLAFLELPPDPTREADAQARVPLLYADVYETRA